MSTYDRNFGHETGIAKRLAYWSNQLAMNKTYPWVGSGLIDDLLCASRVLGADPLALYPGMVGIESPREPVGSESAREPSVGSDREEVEEYDL